MSKSYGIDSKIIQDIWTGKRESASRFGTAIHNALELKQQGKEYGYKDFIDSVNLARNFIQTYGEKGKKITDIKYERALEKAKDESTVVKENNYTYPSHGTLVRLVKEKELEKELDIIVDGFIALSDSLGFTQDIVAEALVTYTPYKMGGYVDRLLIIDKENKVCRVQDYKVNVNSDKKGDKFLHEMSFLEPNKLSEYTIQTNFYAYCLYKAGWTIQGLDAFVFDEDEWKHFELELFDMDWFDKILKDKLNIK